MPTRLGIKMDQRRDRDRSREWMFTNQRCPDTARTQLCAGTAIVLVRNVRGCVESDGGVGSERDRLSAVDLVGSTCRHKLPRWRTNLVEENGGLDRLGLAGAKLLEHVLEGVPRVEDVLHHQEVPPRDIRLRELGKRLGLDPFPTLSS